MSWGKHLKLVNMFIVNNANNKFAGEYSCKLNYFMSIEYSLLNRHLEMSTIYIHVYIV